MEDATSVRKLVELIFSKKFENDEEMAATNSSIPACLPTSDLSDELAELFPLLLRNVLLTKQVIFFYEWENYIETYCDLMFSSHRRYLRCVIFACLYEGLYHSKGCEIFISMCALLKYFNERILESTGMDFRDLNTDVMALLYDDVLKHSFGKKIGYQKLLEYICGHRYLSLKFKDTVSTPADVRDVLLKNRKVIKELVRRDPRTTEEEIEIITATTKILTRKILERTSVELPPLLNDPDLIKCLKGSGNEEKVKKNDKERIMNATAEILDLGATGQGFFSSNSDSSTDYAINHENKVPTGSLDLGATSQRCSSSNSNSIKGLKASTNVEKAEKSESDTE